jgi:hypothetical protein
MPITTVFSITNTFFSAHLELSGSKNSLKRAIHPFDSFVSGCIINMNGNNA